MGRVRFPVSSTHVSGDFFFCFMLSFHTIFTFHRVLSVDDVADLCDQLVDEVLVDELAVLLNHRGISGAARECLESLLGASHGGYGGGEWWWLSKLDDFRALKSGGG